MPELKPKPTETITNQQASKKVEEEIRDAQQGVLQERSTFIEHVLQSSPDLTDAEGASETWLEAHTEKANEVAGIALNLIERHGTAMWQNQHTAQLNRLLDEIKEQNYLNYINRLNTPQLELLKNWVNQRYGERVQEQTQNILKGGE